MIKPLFSMNNEKALINSLFRVGRQMVSASGRKRIKDEFTPIVNDILETIPEAKKLKEEAEKWDSIQSGIA